MGQAHVLMQLRPYGKLMGQAHEHTLPLRVANLGRRPFGFSPLGRLPSGLLPLGPKPLGLLPPCVAGLRSCGF